MKNEKTRHKREHIDESEKWKRSSLMAQKNRQRFSRFTTILLLLAAAAVIAACFYAYFCDAG